MAHTTAHSTQDASVASITPPARKPLVLVIDPNESTRSVLEVAMGRDGFEVWSSATAKQGMLLLTGRTPDAIILEADLGDEDGLTFVMQLRGDDRLANVPVLLLAQAGDQKVEAMADVVDVDDYIQKPAFARDVAALVRVELAKRAGGRLMFDSKALPPAQLLRALMSCPRSGRLLLLEGRAEVRFRSGKVIDARFDTKGGTVDALVRALALTKGSYELVMEPINGFAELQCSLRELVNLVLPRLQKWSRVLQRSLPLDARLTVDFGRLANGLKAMPDEINRVVQLFDGFRSVEQVLLDSSLNETLTLEVATRLYLMGVLGPARASDSELIELRPMPRLFEPRATEAEELMQQLFAGTAEIRSEESSSDAQQDWFSPAAIESELADPNGGWTTAPVPADLALGLAPELAKQLDAFQTPMRVEAPQPAPEVVAAQKFVHAEQPADTVMESALMAAVDARTVSDVEAELNAAIDAKAEAELEAQLAAHKNEARGRQARIETPWMTPVTELPEAPAPVSTEKVADTVIVAPAEQAFFESAPAAAQKELVLEQDETPELELKRERRVWPFVVGGIALVALMLVVDGLRSPEAEQAPAPVAVVPAVVEAAPAPVAEALEADQEVVEEAAAAEETVEAPVAVVDVSENLAEATKLYNAGSYKKAISVLEQVVTDDPKSVAGWNLLAMAKYDNLDTAGARVAADKVLELDPKNGRVQILIASMYFDANQKDLGRAALEKYLELEPNGAHVEEAKALLKR